MNALELVGLGGNPKLSIITFGDEAEWLKLREKRIGGSDAGAILGLNKYSTPLMVYKAKVEGKAKDLSDNPNVRRGKDLEEFVLTHYVQPKMKEYGFQVEKPDFMIVNSDYPYLAANLDGVARSLTGSSVATSILIEIKCVSTFAEDAWDGDEYGGIPPYYYAQVQHYLAVTGMTKAYLVALFDRTWTVKWYPIMRDEAFIADMLPKLKAFYEVNMQAGVPPKAVYSLDKESVAEIAASTPTPSEPSDEMAKLVETYKSISADIKALEKEKDAVMSDIFQMHSDGKFPTKGTVKYTVVKSHKFNQTKFKEDNPNLYEQYCEDVETVRATIK